MSYEFEQYEPRLVSFERIEEVNELKVKVYTISKGEEFRSTVTLENAISNLEEWLKISKKLGLTTHGIANLIVHEGRDGVWSLVNWWVGGEMLQNLTFFSPRSSPDEFEVCPEDGSMACVWEMSVVCHERKAWMKHVLKNAKSPNFKGYLDDVINGLI